MQESFAIDEKTHQVLGGKAYVFKRPNSSYWYCAAYLRGSNYRASTKETILHEAIHFAEEWYFDLRGKASTGTLEQPAKKEITFREVADQFIKEYSVITEGQRSPLWIEGHIGRLRVHLLPFFGDLPISKVTGGKVQEYRVQLKDKIFSASHVKMFKSLLEKEKLRSDRDGKARTSYLYLYAFAGRG